MNKTTLNSQKEKHSLLSLRRATFVGLAAHRLRNISIHALLAESDAPNHNPCSHSKNFYPRSPCGERRFNPPETLIILPISIHALLAESDLSYVTNVFMLI